MSLSFEKKKYDTLDLKVRVAYTLGEMSPNGVIIGPGFELQASAEGIFMGQLMLSSEEDLQTLARAMSEAWEDHKRLKHKIVTPTPGEAEQLGLL